jgi:hypothetical protein
MRPFVPKPMTSNAKAQGRFSKADFIYIARDNEYQCPAGQRLRQHHTSAEDGLRIKVYWTNVCPQCPLKRQCTTGDQRRVRRWEHEQVLDDAGSFDRRPDAMTLRRRTVEHVFGTLKHWMGSTRLPDAAPSERRHRDESPRAPLQPETCDSSAWRRRNDTGDEVARPLRR